MEDTEAVILPRYPTPSLLQLIIDTKDFTSEYNNLVNLLNVKLF